MFDKSFDIAVTPQCQCQTMWTGTGENGWRPRQRRIAGERPAEMSGTLGRLSQRCRDARDKEDTSKMRYREKLSEDMTVMRMSVTFAGCLCWQGREESWSPIKV